MHPNRVKRGNFYENEGRRGSLRVTHTRSGEGRGSGEGRVEVPIFGPS